MKRVYLYDAHTGEFTGIWDAQASPLEPGKFIEPVYSVEDAPPPVNEHQAAVREGGAWVVVADHRGEVWFMADRTPVEVTALGDPAALGYSATEPERPFPEVHASELADFRARREVYLNRLAGIAVALLSEGDGEGATAAAALRRGLLELPERETVNNAPDLESLQQAIAGGMAELVLVAPLRLQSTLDKIFL